MRFKVPKKSPAGFYPASVLTLCLISLLPVGCGGHSPADFSPNFIRSASKNQTCGGCPTKPASAHPPVNPWLNASMMGRHWTLQNAGASCTTWIDVLPAPGMNYYPENSIELHITKSAPECYWAPGVDFAWVDFLLSPAEDGSYYSKGGVMHFPGTVPSWAPSAVYSIEVQPPAGAAMPYMIAPPPSLAEDQAIIYRTSYNRWDYYSENFSSFVSGPPVAHIFWQTIFSVNHGEARSEQREGLCGHESWDWAADVGLVRIAFPNDGDPSCAANPASTTIDRVP